MVPTVAPTLPPPSVFISEVQDKTSGTCGGSWIELYNAGSYNVILDNFNYVLTDSEDKDPFTLTGMIDVGAYFLVCAGGGAASSSGAGFQFSIESTDVITLKNYWGDADSMTLPGNKANDADTYVRNPADGAVMSTAIGTPGVQNIGPIIISEVQDQTSGSCQGSWIELYNTGTTPATMTNYELTNSQDNYPFTLQGSIDGGQYKVICGSSGGHNDDAAAVASSDAARRLSSHEAGFLFSIASDDTLILRSGSGDIDSMTLPNDKADDLSTYIRKIADNSIQSTAIGSPGGQNIGPVIINEIQDYMSGACQSQWVELYNSGSQQVDLSATNYILTITGATDPFSLTGVLDAGAYKIVCGVSKAPTSSPTDLSYNYGYVAQPDYDDPGISPSPLPVPSPTMVPIASPTKAPTNTFSYRQRPTTYSTHKSKNFELHFFTRKTQFWGVFSPGADAWVFFTESWLPWRWEFHGGSIMDLTLPLQSQATATVAPSRLQHRRPSATATRVAILTKGLWTASEMAALGIAHIRMAVGCMMTTTLVPFKCAVRVFRHRSSQVTSGPATATVTAATAVLMLQLASTTAQSLYVLRTGRTRAWTIARFRTCKHCVRHRWRL